MQTSLFDFQLPAALIADRPASPRDASRMLVVKDHSWHDRHICELPDWLQPGDMLVLNDTRVIPARLHGVRGNAHIEILLHKPRSGESICWQAFARPAKRLRVDDTIIFAPDFSARVVEKLISGEVLLAFDMNTADFHAALARHGGIPLPPYIEKKRAGDTKDLQDYQTIYADKEKAASVAAPTAGLHFTPQLLAVLRARGIHTAYITLHVGAGTFLPVKVDSTEEHVMHSEWAEISEDSARSINEAKKRGGRIVAVGTTSLRTLESAANERGHILPFCKETDIFITPGYRFKAVDILLTNFHLPKSTLFMLVSAFCGLQTMQKAYAHAIANNYRFYSYGDACLLIRN